MSVLHIIQDRIIYKHSKVGKRNTSMMLFLKGISDFYYTKHISSQMTALDAIFYMSLYPALRSL